MQLVQIYLTVGPSRFLVAGTSYGNLYYGFLLGLFLPLIPWLLNKLYPHHWWHLINPVHIMQGSQNVGGIQAGILYRLFFGFVFQWYCFRKKREWFNKYLYVLGAALGFGAGLTTLAVQIIVQVTPKHNSYLRPVNMDYYCYDGSPTETSTNEVSVGKS